MRWGELKVPQTYLSISIVASLTEAGADVWFEAKTANRTFSSSAQRRPR